MPISPARVLLGVAGAVVAFGAAFGVSVAVLRRTTPSFAVEAQRTDARALDALPASVALDAGPAEDAAPEEPPPPSLSGRTFNVVLITVDTLRIDLGFLGYEKPVSPNLDALASRSTVFERAYSLASYTSKSVGPTLIGRYASETHRDFEHFTTYYPANTFLAERLQRAGVRTIGGMCHYYFKWETGHSRGFDVWDTSAIAPGMHDGDDSVTSDRLTDLALKLLEDPLSTGDAGAPPEGEAGASEAGAGPQRFFAWFHYFDPHARYVPHAGAPDFKDEKSSLMRVLYDQEIWFTDKHIGRLLDHIAAQPWGAETAVVLTADHGEAFGEHNIHTHGREVWEPLVRVPLVVFVPGVAPRRIGTRRSLIDLAPTVLELMGVPGDDKLRGVSLVEDTLGVPPEERDVYIDMPEGPYNEERHALITGPTPGLKLIHFGGDRYQLYDLADDPGERRNLAGDRALMKGTLSRFSAFRDGMKEIRVTGARKGP